MTEPFKFSDGQLAYTAEELLSLCKQFPTESLDFLMREDFEKWLNYIGKSDLATKAQQVRQASLSDGDRIKQFITQCQPIPVAAQKSAPQASDVSKPKATVAPTTKATVAPAAAKVTTASTTTKATVAPAAAKVSTASTAIKKPNPLASLLQKLFGKK